MQKIIVTSPEELSELFESMVRKVIRETKQTDTNLPNEFLTIEEAAQYLGLAKQTLYGFTSQRKIPFIKRAKKLVFRKSDLDAWLLEGRKKSISEISKEIESH